LAFLTGALALVIASGKVYRKSGCRRVTDMGSAWLAIGVDGLLEGTGDKKPSV
jgi:hypothetical protein